MYNLAVYYIIYTQTDRMSSLVKDLIDLDLALYVQLHKPKSAIQSN